MKIEGVLTEARFIQRLNRFDALVEIGGEAHHTHVPNSGRLRELLTEGATVLVREFDNPGRKTRFGLLLARKDGRWVSVDSSSMPNKIVHEALTQGRFKQFCGYGEIRREVTMGSSRFDFGLFADGREYYIEVKGVSLVEGGTAYFPDAPTERGTKHLEELARLKRDGKGAGVVFIVQREDADAVRPNDRTDRPFGDALRAAREAGVGLWAYTCRIDPGAGCICIDREIPVRAEWVKPPQPSPGETGA